MLRKRRPPPLIDDETREQGNRIAEHWYSMQKAANEAFEHKMYSKIITYLYDQKQKNDLWGRPFDLGDEKGFTDASVWLREVLRDVLE